jgi:Fe-S cluster assembly iron-binding protein IscA
VEKNGLKVFIDAKTSGGLSGMQMDFVEEKEGSGFVLKGQSAGPAHDCSSCGH